MVMISVPQCGENAKWVHEGSACPNTCVNEQAEDTCNKPDVEGKFKWKIFHWKGNSSAFRNFTITTVYEYMKHWKGKYLNVI